MNTPRFMTVGGFNKFSVIPGTQTVWENNSRSALSCTPWSKSQEWTPIYMVTVSPSGSHSCPHVQSLRQEHWCPPELSKYSVCLNLFTLSCCHCCWPLLSYSSVRLGPCLFLWASNCCVSLVWSIFFWIHSPVTEVADPHLSVQLTPSHVLARVAHILKRRAQDASCFLSKEVDTEARLMATQCNALQALFLSICPGALH